MNSGATAITGDDLARRLIGNVQALLDHFQPPTEIVNRFLERPNVELAWMVIGCRDKYATTLLAVDEPLRSQEVHGLLESHQRNTPLLGELAPRRQLPAGRQFAGLNRMP